MKKNKPCFNRCNHLINNHIYSIQRYFCLIFVLSFILVINLLAQESRVWNYPVHPGTPEWEKLATFHEHLNAYNVPDDLLKIMTTSDLVQTCLTYPRWILVTSQNDYQAGYDFIRSAFNGFRELEKHTDACHELISVYEKMNSEVFLNNTNEGQIQLEFFYFDIILSQQPILNNITDDDLVKLIKLTLSAYKRQRSKENWFNASMTCLVLCRILAQKNIASYENLCTVIPGFLQYVEGGHFTTDVTYLV